MRLDPSASTLPGEHRYRCKWTEELSGGIPKGGLPSISQPRRPDGAKHVTLFSSPVGGKRGSRGERGDSV